MIKKTTKKNLGGRPRKELTEKDWELLDVFCQYKHPQEDIAFLLEISVDTLDLRIKERYGVGFTEFRNQKQVITRNKLYAKQLEVALSGNVPMLIWLGKNILGQSDKEEVHRINIEGPVFVDEENKNG